MKIKLKKTVARNSAVDEYDIKQIKKALNRLGYYAPLEATGITGIPDAALFEALKRFQEEHGIRATGEAKPGDETVQALSREAAKTPDGSYIWRTVEDDKVRSAHAQYNRKIRQWADAPDPGEEFNCRCWAEPVKASTPKADCDKVRRKFVEAQNRVKDLSEKFNDLLLRLDKLVEENNQLIKNTQKSLGVTLVAYLLTLPFDKLGVLGDLLQRYFQSIISKELIEAAKKFMQQLWATKQKIQYTKDQTAIVFIQLENASKELEKIKENLKACEENGKKITIKQ